MKQGEEILSSLGEGYAKIRELSNSPDTPRPKLTLMMPAEVEVISYGFSDTIVAHHPARSFALENSDHVKQLYELLKSYFERTK